MISGLKQIGSKRFLIGILIAAILQTGFLVGNVWSHMRNIANGTKIVLETEARDPRDIFRGHYVTLQIKAENMLVKDVMVDPSILAESANTSSTIRLFPPKNQLDVFIGFEKGEGMYWIPKTVTREKPSSGTYLKAKLRRPNKPAVNLRAELPFKKYFAPKKRAQDLEKLRQAGDLGIIVSVLPDGSGRIAGISVGGKTVFDETLF